MSNPSPPKGVDPAQIWGYLVFNVDGPLWAAAAGTGGPVGAFREATDAVLTARRLGQGPLSEAQRMELIMALRRAETAGVRADTVSLNRLYPDLGDRFASWLMAGAAEALRAIEQGDQDALARSQTAFHRWSSYWNANGLAIQQRMQGDSPLPSP